MTLAVAFAWAMMRVRGVVLASVIVKPLRAKWQDVPSQDVDGLRVCNVSLRRHQRRSHMTLAVASTRVMIRVRGGVLASVVVIPPRPNGRMFPPRF